MAKVSRPPTIKKVSFDCPHCGAFAHHSWMDACYAPIADRGTPTRKPCPEHLSKALTERLSSQTTMIAIAEASDASLQIPFLGKLVRSTDPIGLLNNVFFSKCVSCGKLAIWSGDRLIYPPSALEIQPHPEMPDDVRADFDEARQLFFLSPRGAAALLRLSIQKLCVFLGERGKNLDTDIANLVAKGLHTKVQQALDIVRVIGNEAVHPGQIDLRDEPEAAEAMFGCVNEIVDEMLAKPKALEALYKQLPAEKLEAIERRDKSKK